MKLNNTSQLNFDLPFSAAGQELPAEPEWKF